MQTRLGLCIEAGGKTQTLAPTASCDAQRDKFSERQTQLLILIEKKGGRPHSSTFPSPSFKRDEVHLEMWGLAAETYPDVFYLVTY